MKQQTSWNESDERPPGTDKGVYAQLMKAKGIVTKADQDRVYIVTGREGLGKSTLALQLAYCLDRKLTLENVVFTSKDFEDRIRNCQKHTSIVFDECFNGLSSKGSLSRENKNLVKLLMECRQQNLFIFLVLPSFFLLEKYAAIFRSHGLFNVMASRQDFSRRYYKIYNYNQKKILYILGKQMMNYSKPHIMLSHRFYGKMPQTITKEDYVKKKLAAFRDIGEDPQDDPRQVKQRDALLYHMNKVMGISQSKIVEILSKHKIIIDQSAISLACTKATKRCDTLDNTPVL